MGVKPCKGNERGEHHSQDPYQARSSGLKGHRRGATGTPLSLQVHSSSEEREEGLSSGLSWPRPWWPCHWDPLLALHGSHTHIIPQIT